MTDHKKETVWITIPDEATPALDALMKETNKASSNKVAHKAFWSAGLITLLVFSAVLFAPQELFDLVKAQLFDGTFQVVPDYQDQGGTLFKEGEEGEAEAEEDQPFEDEMVVEAESDAVSIQIEPLEDTEVEASAEGDADSEATSIDSETEVDAESTADTDAVTEAESIVIDDSGAVHSAAEEVDEAEETLDANAKLLQSLSQQLAEFKEKERQNDQRIQDLLQLLEDRVAGVNVIGATQFPPVGQAITQPITQFGVGALTGPAAGVYRYNTHTVTVSPYDILAQNQGAQQASYQANVAYNAIQPYSQQAYNPVLATVQGQPGTGPAESFLFALALASLGVLVWGTMRAIRA